MNMKKFFASLSLFILTITVAGCMAKPEAYKQAGRPEALLDYSSERVTFGLGTANALDDITAWVNKDQPSRAEVSCYALDSACSGLKRILTQFGVNFTEVPSKDGGNSVVLIYDRVSARDCDNRYVDNATSNSLNLNHKTFGCSVAVNTVQMVGERSQFNNPQTLGSYDAESGIKAVEKVYKEKGKKKCPCSGKSGDCGCGMGKPMSMGGPKPGAMCPVCPKMAEAKPVHHVTPVEPAPMQEPASAPVPDVPSEPK